MQVRQHITADGSTSYEWVSWTEDEWNASLAASDGTAWIEANATVIETIRNGLIVPPGS